MKVLIKALFNNAVQYSDFWGMNIQLSPLQKWKLTYQKSKRKEKKKGILEGFYICTWMKDYFQWWNNIGPIHGPSSPSPIRLQISEHSTKLHNTQTRKNYHQYITNPNAILVVTNQGNLPQNQMPSTYSSSNSNLWMILKHAHPHDNGIKEEFRSGKFLTNFLWNVINNNWKFESFYNTNKCAISL